jgi:glycosyltransferase involved in cell wall biosynthesis
VNPSAPFPLRQPRPLRIAHVTATFPPYWGGTGNVAWHNARELARRGHEVHVFTAGGSAPGPGRPAGDGSDPIDPEGVRVHRLTPLLRVGNAPVLPGLLPALRGFDLIHLHYPFFVGAELVWAAARLFRVPYVVTYHNALIGAGARAPLFRFWEAVPGRLTLGGSARVAAVSLDHAAAQPSLQRLSPGTLAEVPNGVDTTVFHPGAADPGLRAAFGIPADAPLLLFVAALDRAHYFKGLDRLLDALTLLRPHPAHLLVVGDGDDRARYEARVDTLGLRPMVRFAGAVPHRATARYFASAELLVLPTGPPESFGMVLVEALACGTPVVASDIPGVRAVVRSTGGGLLVPPGDAGRLAETIAALLADPDRRAHLASSGRAAVLAHYSWPAVTRRLEALYADALLCTP